MEMEKEPFIIRDHHLIKTYYYFSLAVQDLNILRGFIKLDSADMIHHRDEGREYVDDVFGDSPLEYREEYTNKLMNYLTCFRSLPDSAPVHLDSQRDGICFACKIGNHCLQEGSENDYMNKRS